MSAAAGSSKGGGGGGAGAAGASPLGEADVPALTLAMALAPGVYSRNRFFALFEAKPLRRARARAWVLRSVARDVARGPCEVSVASRDAAVELALEVPSLAFTRRVRLSALELAGLRVLLAKTPQGALLPAAAADHAAVGAALATLSGPLAPPRGLGEAPRAD